MKRLASLAVATALLGSLSAPLAVQAATATAQFDVTINLTSACEITAPTGATFNYTSLQATDATFASNFTVRCTNGLPITSIALDATEVTDTATGLAYTLALSNAPTIGSGVAQTVSLNGRMAAGQAGTCSGSICTNASSPAANKQRTLTITY